MNSAALHDQLRQIAQTFLTGDLPVTEFLAQISLQTPVALADATVDVARWGRCGFPEVIYASGKSTASLLRIMQRLCDAGQPVLATRVNDEQAVAALEHFADAQHNAVARTLRIDRHVATRPAGKQASDRGEHYPVAIVTAGTSDLPIAEEARETVEWMGQPTFSIHDVGVAGPHRLPAHIDQLRSAAVVVVVAGMEGTALASIVGGYVPCPVIAVPTSVGYGASFGGIAALLGMLNSCAANVTVVNIDAGFKAGYLAGLIASRTRSGAEFETSAET